MVDFSSQISGPYATKLFVDAGADVIKVERESGDPLRAWSATGADLAGEDGALFRFLNHGKRSVVGSPADEAILELVASADLVVEDFAPGVMDALDLPGRFPGLVWLSITPWGRGGPWDGRPWSEFTVQAQCGSIGVRGLPGREPFQQCTEIQACTTNYNWNFLVSPSSRDFIKSQLPPYSCRT